MSELNKKIIPLRSEPMPAADDGQRMIVTMTKNELAELIGGIINQKLSNRMGEDRVVNIEEAVNILSVSESWIYHHAKKLPFARKVGGTLRFSVNGMQRWMESKKFS